MKQTTLFARWSDHQLTRLELVFCFIILLVLISVFLNYVTVMLARAERAMVETSIVNLNSALRVSALREHISATGNDQLESSINNPIRFLKKRISKTPDRGMPLAMQAVQMQIQSQSMLPNYAGELVGSEGLALAPGSWYYDPGAEMLVYMVRNSEMFRSELTGPARIRYELRYDRNNTGLPALVAIDDYQWLF